MANTADMSGAFQEGIGAGTGQSRSELGGHRRAAHRGLAIELGQRVARLDALLSRLGAQDQHRRTAMRRGEAVHGVEPEQPAAIDDGDAIAQPRRFFHVVRRVDDGLARRLQLQQAVEDGVARLGIDADRRFVEQHEVGIVEDRCRQVQPPLHAARIGVDQVAAALAESDELERPDDALGETRRRHPVDAAEEGQVLLGRQELVERERLRRHADAGANGRLPRRAQAADVDLAGRRLDDAHRHVDGRALAGAVRPQQPENLTLAYR
jgi:hypothetical protein